MGPPYASIVEAVNFGSLAVRAAAARRAGPAVWRPAQPPRRDVAEVEGNGSRTPGGVQIPDSDSLQADACGPGYRYDALTRLVLESKEDMRRRGAQSPDEWDAVALTFARPVAPPAAPSRFWCKIEYPKTGWM